MSEFDDPQYLLAEQYKDASNFSERLTMLERLSTNTIDWYRWLFNAIKLPAGEDILELGCGPGYLWQRNLDRIPANWRITLSDFSVGMLEAARQNLQESSRSWQFEVVDAQKIPFQENTYDVVIANAMLYHVPDRQQAFSGIRRVLRPGGFFYATTLTDDSVSQLSSLVSRMMEKGQPEFPGFSEGSAREELSPWFESIEEQVLATNTVVTEAEPMVRFIRSLLPQSQRDEQALQSMYTRFDQLLSEKGKIEWSMGVALFICSSLATE